MKHCRLCHSQDTIKSFISPDTHGRHLNKKKHYQVYYCNSCSVYFLGPEEKKQNYYSLSYPSSYYSTTPLITKFIMSIFGLLTPKKHSIISNHFPKKTKIKILDIGCSRGEFLNSLPSNRYIKFGVEINPEIAKIASSSGLNITTGDFNQINFKSQKFDCITLWHVLEHLPDPTTTLQQISKILKPNGLLIFIVPNSNSIGFKYGHKNFFHLDSPRHLFIPNKRSIHQLLQKSKFTKIKFKNTFLDYPLDLFWSIRKSNIKYLVYPFYFIFKIFSSELLQVTATISNKSVKEKNYLTATKFKK